MQCNAMGEMQRNEIQFAIKRESPSRYCVGWLGTMLLSSMKLQVTLKEVYKKIFSVCFLKLF